MAKFNPQALFECVQSELHSFYEAGKFYHGTKIDGVWRIDDKYGVPHSALQGADCLTISGELQYATGSEPTEVKFKRVE